MAKASVIGRDPALLREWISQEVENEEARDTCLGWMARSEQADIERLFISFSLASP
jgi:hypothetical protein